MRYGIMEGDHGEDFALRPADQRRGLVADQIVGLVNQAEALVEEHVLGQVNNPPPEPEPMDVDEQIIEEIVLEQVEAVVQEEGQVQEDLRNPNHLVEDYRNTSLEYEYTRALVDYYKFIETLGNTSSLPDSPDEEEHDLHEEQQLQDQPDNQEQHDPQEQQEEDENEVFGFFRTGHARPLNEPQFPERDNEQPSSSLGEAFRLVEEQGSGHSHTLPDEDEDDDEEEEEGGDILTKIVECATGPIISKAIAVVRADVEAREAKASSGEPEREVSTSEPVVINLTLTANNYMDIVRRITFDNISFSDYTMLTRPELIQDTYDNVSEYFEDIFSVDTSWALAHCVSSDLAMFRGIALEFRRRFENIQFLRQQFIRPGHVAVLNYLTPEDRTGRFIFYLVTKQIFNQKPTYFNIYSCLVRMRTICQALNITKVAMPRIASGCDRMDFRKVKHLIHVAFMGSKIQVRVYTKI